MGLIAVIEGSCKSKLANLEEAEDEIYIGENFCAVIDGATSKTKSKIDGLTPGKFAAVFIKDSFKMLEPSTNAKEVVKYLNESLKEYYVNKDLYLIFAKRIEARPSASVIIYSKYHNQVWSVGDCKCLIGDREYSNEKLIDVINSQVRSFVNKFHLNNGLTIDDIKENDPGREFIMPLLLKQFNFQNTNSGNEYSYHVIDGFGSPEEHVKIIDVPKDCNEIVLASDGYPKLLPTLEETQKYLKIVLEKDPLLIDDYKSTKGLVKGNESFDDRSYLRIQV